MQDSLSVEVLQDLVAALVANHRPSIETYIENTDPSSSRYLLTLGAAVPSWCLFGAPFNRKDWRIARV